MAPCRSRPRRLGQCQNRSVQNMVMLYIKFKGIEHTIAMDLGVVEKGFIFCVKHPLLSKDSGERSRAQWTSCLSGLVALSIYNAF